MSLRIGSLAVAVMLTAVACSQDPSVRKQEFLESGNRYAEQGKFREAVIEYRNAVQLDPRFGDARARLAAAYAKTGEPVRALNEYVRAADLLPERADVQLAAGQYLLIARRPQEALARADAALKAKPNDIDALILRGNALGGLNDFDKALEEIEEAIRLDPARGASYTQLGLVEQARGRSEQAEAAFQKAVTLAPKALSGYLALANFYWASGRLAEAERAFRTSLELEPANQIANRAMAAFSLAMGRTGEAEPYLKRLADSATPTAVFALTDYYVATGRPKEAITRLESLAEASKQAPATKQRLAGAYAAAGDKPTARKLVAELLASNPRDADAHLLNGQLLLEDGKRDEALTSVRAAVEARPEHIAAQFALGRLFAARGDIAGAEQAFREVIRLNPRATAAQVELSRLELTTGTAEASVRTAEQAVRNQPDSFDARLALVRGLVAQRDLARAERELAPLLKVGQNSAAVHTLRGLVLGERKNIAGAREAFERALELEPTSIEPLAGLIGLDLASRQPDAAKARIDSRLAAVTPTANVLVLAARTYASAGDAAGAEKLLRRAIEADPGLQTAYGMLGQLYVSQRRLDEARREFEALAQRQSRPVAAITMAGMIAQFQGNNAVARQRFEQALAVDARAAVAANNLAWMLAESGSDLDRALQLAQAATDAAPEVPEMLDTLGWIYYKKQMPALAVPALTRCVEKVPANPVYHFHLGLAHAQAGDADKARRSLERALALRPDFNGADEARRTLAGLGAPATR